MKNPPKKYMIRISRPDFFNGSEPYIYESRVITFSQDQEVADFLNIHVKHYRKTLVKQFKGFLSNPDPGTSPIVYFKTREAAQAVIDWINFSCFMTKKAE